MNKLYSVIAFFCLYYPHKNELSKARLTKLVYLADWFSALLDRKTMTDIKWVFNHYGPYVNDVCALAALSDDFTIESTQTIYGDYKEIIVFHGDDSGINLSGREKDILSAIIEKTQKMYFNDFINYVYSTYPVSSNERYADLDLISLAEKFRSQKSATA